MKAETPAVTTRKKKAKLQTFCNKRHPEALSKQ